MALRKIWYCERDQGINNGRAVFSFSSNSHSNQIFPNPNDGNNYPGDLVKHAILGDYVKEKLPSLKQFMTKENSAQEYDIPYLAALASAMRLLQWCKLSLEQLIQIT